MKLQLQGLILSDTSFRHREDPLGRAVQTAHTSGTVQVEMELLSSELPDTYAIKLTVALDPTSTYVASVSYVAMVNVDLEGAERPENFEDRILAMGSAIAYPYAREMMSNLTSRGRFGVVWINPINFNKTISQKPEAHAAASE